MRFARPIALVILAGLPISCGTTNSQRIGSSDSFAIEPLPETKAQPAAAPAPKAFTKANFGGSRQAALDNVPTAAAIAAGPNFGDRAEFAGEPDLTPTRETPTLNVSRVTFAEEGADFDPSVSRDGAKLVFASTQHRRTADIYIKNTEGRVVTQLTNDPADDINPVISPDGTKIAFASNRGGNWDIYVMPVTGGKAVQVTDDPSNEIHPSWSPDGRQLVFSRESETSGRWEMWIVETANPSASHYIGDGLFPQWCPVAATGGAGADRIMYQLPRERGRRSYAVWTVDISNGRATNASEIASSASTALINPAWSPDGRWIVFSEVTAPATPGAAARPAQATLWMTSLNGEARVRLTSGAGVSLGPVWGPQNRLFFVSDRTGADNIWSMDVGTAVQAAMTSMNLSDSATASTKETSEQTPAHPMMAHPADNSHMANVGDAHEATPTDH
ncbi:MAG: DPP IV N-terminal domain-containing protein [Phycisphaerales bacterium]|jgi:Tol biopolymer transport system component